MIGEPIKQPAKLIGEPIKITGKPALRITLLQVFGGDRAKTRRVGSLHQDVEALLLAQQAADAEYERVAARNVEVCACCALRLSVVCRQRCCSAHTL